MTALEAPRAPAGRSFLRVWFPLVLIVLASIAGAGVWTWPSERLEFIRRVNLTMLGGMITLLLLAFWLLFLSGWPAWLRLSLPFVVLLGAWAAVREVHFTGDLVPIVQFRWTRSHDSILEAHRQHQAASAPFTVDVTVATTDFPAYRGPKRDGIAHGPTLVRDWQAHPPRRLWRQPIGGGYAAFAVAGNVAVTIEQRRDAEAVVCYDRASGEEYWVHSYPAHFSERLGGDGPRATPTIADNDVFSLGANGRLVCLELRSGKLKWAVDILENNDNLPWGMSGSPLVYDQVVIVNPGVQRSTASGKAVVAYDRATGRQVWSAGNTQAGYSSPMLVQLAGRRQILVFDGEGLGAYDAQAGTELWRFPWQNDQQINVAQPIVLDGERVFLSCSYGKGCAMLRIKESAGKITPGLLWENMNLRCKFTSPVAYQGHLYGLDEGILTCLDAKDGTRKWKGGRYGHGQVLLQDDLLVILSETGKLVLVQATPEGHHELASLAAVEGKTWNNPALADGKAYLRNSEEMACYDLAEKR